MIVVPTVEILLETHMKCCETSPIAKTRCIGTETRHNGNLVSNIRLPSIFVIIRYIVSFKDVLESNSVPGKIRIEIPLQLVACFKTLGKTNFYKVADCLYLLLRIQTIYIRVRFIEGLRLSSTKSCT